MASLFSLDTRFKKTEIEKFAADPKVKNEDQEYWKYLQHPVSIQEFGPIHHIDICAKDPHYIAVSASTKIQVINPLTNGVFKSFAKFRDEAYGAVFRSDGQLISAGCNDGQVKLFSLTHKTLLRTFIGHANATRRCDFMADFSGLASFSDDRLVKTWDLASETETFSFSGHTDYVRAGCACKSSSSVLVSGSYDHTVRLWDRRLGNCTLTLNHGSPVEDVLLMPNGILLFTAGGTSIKVWDLLAGGRLLTVIQSHNKTITSLGLASNATRLVSSSLDRHVQLHSISTFKTMHTIPFPSPVLTAAVSPDNNFVCAGMSDGLVQIVHRKVPSSIEDTKQERRPKYLQYTSFTPEEGDIVVKQDKRVKENRFDFFLRKFEYTKALDQVLKPYVQHKFPEYTFSVLKELKRRNGLKTALSGRDDKSLTLLLQYIVKYINDARFSRFLVEVVHLMLDLYGFSLGNNPSTDKLFLDMKKKVDKEARNLRLLTSLQGSLDLILSATSVQDQPDLRCEEKWIQKSLVNVTLPDHCKGFALYRTMIK